MRPNDPKDGGLLVFQDDIAHNSKAIGNEPMLIAGVDALLANRPV